MQFLTGIDHRTIG